MTVGLERKEGGNKVLTYFRGRSLRKATRKYMTLKAGSQYDATLTQHNTGRGVNYAGIGSISNPASRCVSIASYCEPAFSLNPSHHVQAKQEPGHGITNYTTARFLFCLHLETEIEARCDVLYYTTCMTYSFHPRYCISSKFGTPLLGYNYV